MNRCDICHTVIPPGAKECPKCGYHFPGKISSQPHVQTKIGKTVFEKKTKVKSAKQNKKIHSEYIGIIIIGLLIGLVTMTSVRQVMNAVLNQDNTFGQYQDGEYRDFESLNLNASKMAQEILPYYKKIKRLETSESDLYERYVVEDETLTSVDINLDLFFETHIEYYSVRNFSGKVYYLAGHIEFSDFMIENFKPDDIKKIADFCEIDLETLYQQCQDFYQQGKKEMNQEKTETYYDGMQYGEYELSIEIDQEMVSFNARRICG